MLQRSRSSLYWCTLALRFSLRGPVEPRSQLRRDYTPARQCSVPHRGFALSGRALIIIVQETSNDSPVAFDAVWCIVMPSSLSSRITGCVSIIKALLTHMITGMAHWHIPSPLGNQTQSPPPPPRCIPFPHHYSMTRMGDSVFFKGPLWWHTLNLVHLLWVYELYTVKSITNPFKVAETVALLTVWKYS